MFKETGCTDRLSDTVQNALMNIVTILLSTAVGSTMVGSSFLTAQTLKIVVLGVVAFGISTAGGLLGGNVMCLEMLSQIYKGMILITTGSYHTNYRSTILAQCSCKGQYRSC